MKRLLPLSGALLSLAAFVPLPAFSQTLSATALPAKSVEEVARVAALQAAFKAGLDDATAKAKLGNLDAAEASLSALYRRKTGTAEHHAATAQRLIEVAGRLAREGETTTAGRLADRALNHLTQCIQLAESSSDTRAAAATLAAFVHERYKGDLAAAKEDLRAALRINPNGKTAREELTRLEMSSAPAGKEGGSQ